MNKLKEWQNMIEQKVACHEISASRLFTVMRDKQIELYQQLEQYKSIVKKVDADNIPDAEVLCIGDFNRLLFGQIDYCQDNEELFVLKHDDVLSNPTHYIEIADLINLFNGASK